MSYITDISLQLIFICQSIDNTYRYKFYTLWLKKPCHTTDDCSKRTSSANTKYFSPPFISMYLVLQHWLTVDWSLFHGKNVQTVFDWSLKSIGQEKGTKKFQSNNTRQYITTNRGKKLLICLQHAVIIIKYWVLVHHPWRRPPRGLRKLSKSWKTSWQVMRKSILKKLFSLTKR